MSFKLHETHQVRRVAQPERGGIQGYIANKLLQTSLVADTRQAERYSFMILLGGTIVCLVLIFVLWPTANSATVAPEKYYDPLQQDNQ